MASVERVPSNYKVLGLHKLTTDFATSSTHTTYQDEGLSVSVSYGPSRILAVSWQCDLYVPGGTNGIQAQFFRTSTSIVKYSIASHSLSTTAGTNSLYRFVFNGPAVGATETFKVRIQAFPSNTAVNSYADATVPRYLLVEDLGPQ